LLFNTLQEYRDFNNHKAGEKGGARDRGSKENLDVPRPATTRKLRSQEVWLVHRGLTASALMRCRVLVRCHWLLCDCPFALELAVLLKRSKEAAFVRADAGRSSVQALALLFASLDVQQSVHWDASLGTAVYVREQNVGETRVSTNPAAWVLLHKNHQCRSQSSRS
jgi:hypothetical protein